MIKISNLTLWKREKSVSAASGLAGLAFALAAGCVSMSVLLWSGDALAVNECRAFPGFGADHYTNPTATGRLSEPTSPNNRPECAAGNGADNYQLGGASDDRDDRGFPLTAEDDGTRTSPAPEGNIVYSLNDFIKLQTYTPPGSTVAVNRPWWQDECTDDEGQMCWTTIAGSVTAVPAGKTIYYRLIDADDTTFDPGDYQAGPLASVDGVTMQIAAPTGATAATDQVATKGADNIAPAVHNRLFLNAASPPDYPHRAQLHMGWSAGIVVRGVKERVYLDNGVADRVPRILVNGEDEDGFGRYAATFDASTDIGMRVDRVNFYFWGRGNSNSQNVLIEGGADKVSKIENDQINTEGGSRDGGGIDFGGDAKNMLMQLGNLNTRPYVVRATVIARSAGADSSFHAVHFHQDTERGGFAKLEMRDATIQMLNGGDTAPEEGRGMIVTTGTDSSGITISVANPVGDADSDDEATGGINVQVNTPVTIKTSGASSHGIVLNLGYDTEQAKRIEALEQRAAVLLEAKHRDTALWVGMTEGTVHRALNNLRATTEKRTGSTEGVPGYEPSVRIATNGDKSGGIVIRNSGASGEGGEHVRLGGLKVTFDDTGTGGSNEASIAGVDSSPDFASSDLAAYSLVLDKQIVTTGAGSHGVKASIQSGITMVVDIEDLGLNDDPATTDVDESATIRASGAALSGAGDGAFTVNVKGNVKGDIVTGSGDDTITVGFIDEDDDDNNKSPTITGDIDSGAGCDTVDLKAGVTVSSVSLGGCNDGDKQNVLMTGLTTIANVAAGGNSKLDLTIAGGTTGRTFSTVTVLADPNQGTARTDRTTVMVDGGTVSRLTSANTDGYNTKVVVGTNNPVTIGAVALGGGHDTLDWVSDVGSISSIDGGGGNDEVTLRSGMVTSMTGVETFTKKGAGMLTVETINGDPIEVNVEQGRLVVSGLLNLGTGGTLTVKKYGLLSISIQGMSDQDYDDANQPTGTLSHGRIVGQVVMEAAVPQIELVSGSADDNTEAKKDEATTLSRLISSDDNNVVNIVNSAGTNVKDSLQFTIGSEALPGTPGGNRAAVAGDDDNTAIYAVGALAVLWWVMRRDDMGGGSGLVDYESGTGDSSFAGHSGLRTHSSGAVKTWANYHSDSTAPVQGLAVGLEAPISSHGSFSFSAMPEAKGSLSLNTLSLNQKSSFQGGHYSVKGKWQSEDYFAAAELSYADAVSSTSFDNSVAGGKLGGKFDMTGSHLEISAGAKVQLTDKVSVAPTVGVYGGSVSQSESVLTGRNVVARLSKQEQSYAGWNLGLRVRPDAWTAGGAEFQPNISWNTFRTSSDRHSVDLRQSDKAGVLDFSSQLPVQGMPAVVNAFRAGMTMKSETGLQLDLDYVGMEIDGELQHGAIARMQTRF